jgi:hypothetical protein
MKKTSNSLEWWDKTYSEASQLARWIALFEAVNMVADKAEEKNIPFNKVDIKPLAIYRYMESTENIILNKILKEIYNINVAYSEDLSENDLLVKNAKCIF